MTEIPTPPQKDLTKALKDLTAKTRAFLQAEDVIQKTAAELAKEKATTPKR